MKLQDLISEYEILLGMKFWPPPPPPKKKYELAMGWSRCPDIKPGGVGGYFHMYAYWVCAPRETPIFSPEFPFRSISFSQITNKSVLEHHHFTFFGGFCHSRDHNFPNFFNFNPFIASHGRLSPNAMRSAVPRVISRPERQPDASWQFRRVAFSRSKRIKLVPEPRNFMLDRELVPEPGPIFHFAVTHTYRAKHRGGPPPPPPPSPVWLGLTHWRRFNFAITRISHRPQLEYVRDQRRRTIACPPPPPPPPPNALSPPNLPTPLFRTCLNGLTHGALDHIKMWSDTIILY